MPLDRQAEALLAYLAQQNLPAVHTVTPAVAREMARTRAAALLKGPEAEVANRAMPGPTRAIPIRTYRPLASAGATLPAVVYFHGGGFVIGDLDQSDGDCRRIATGTPCMVISVDYALAPEHKYPAAVHECLAALQWVLVHAAELGIDSERVAVAGDSAGANLATVVAAAQSRAVGSPALVGQILLYPVADLANFDSGSYREHAEGLFLTRDTMRWFASHYLRSTADALLEQVSPLRAKDLSQLPRALVITAEYDPLRDEGEAYAARLQAAGVSTQLTRYPGMIHGFFSMSAFLDGGKAATTEVLGSLRDVFGIPERARV